MGIQQLTEEKYVNLVKVNYPSSDGKEKSWVYATRNKLEELPCIKTNAVVIGATIDDKLCVIKEFRPSIQSYQWSVPAGLIDENEDIQSAVARELFEETGLTVKEVLYNSPMLASSPGITDEIVKIVMVKAEGKPTNKNNEADEDIQVKLLSWEQVEKLLFSNDSIIDAKAFGIFISFIVNETSKLNNVK